jgi:hypothetical protein
MGLFKSNHLTGWSHDDDGVAVFFKKQALQQKLWVYFGSGSFPSV